jgi:hypothetical protein
MTLTLCEEQLLSSSSDDRVGSFLCGDEQVTARLAITMMRIE